MKVNDPDKETITEIYILSNESIVWSNKNGKVYLFNPQSMSSAPVELVKVSEPITTMSVDLKEMQLATGLSTGIITLWDIKGINKPVANLIGHISGVNQLCFCPVRPALGSCSYDGTIRIWNIENPDEQSITLRSSNSWLFSIAISPDGSRLISGGVDQTIRLWIVDQDILADKICNMVKRNLTHEEWNKYIGADIEYCEICSEINNK
jgi:WD40 repeat protein